AGRLEAQVKKEERMASAAPTAPASPRLSWLDGMKGISILWIAFFHFFGTYANGRYPNPLGPHYFSSFVSQCAPSSLLGTVGCLTQGFLVATALVGFHAVSVFLVLSGFGLTYSLARTGEPEGGWLGWYRARLLRLFPMYWLAHLVYLVSPFISRPEPLDYRFLLSFLGDRIYPIDMIFFYANPALWYFGLLLELYLVFPVLFRLLQKLGVTWFLVLCGLETLISRYLLLYVISASGNYLLGAFFGTRLWEFAAGMALGLLFRRQRAVVEERLFTGWTFLSGVLIYMVGLYSYATSLSYTIT